MPRQGIEIKASLEKQRLGVLLIQCFLEHLIRGTPPLKDLRSSSLPTQPLPSNYES